MKALKERERADEGQRYGYVRKETTFCFSKEMRHHLEYTLHTCHQTAGQSLNSHYLTFPTSDVSALPKKDRHRPNFLNLARVSYSAIMVQHLLSRSFEPGFPCTSSIQVCILLYIQCWLKGCFFNSLHPLRVTFLHRYRVLSFNIASPAGAFL